MTLTFLLVLNLLVVALFYMWHRAYRIKNSPDQSSGLATGQSAMKRNRNR